MERAYKFGPLPHFEIEVGDMVEKRGRLNLYYEEAEDNKFIIFLGRKTKSTLAFAVPNDQIKIEALIRQHRHTYLRTPQIPIESNDPTIENVAYHLFAEFIPKTYPFAQGKTIDLYKVGHSVKSRGLPDVRISYKGNLAVVSHPYLEGKKGKDKKAA